MQTLMTDLGLSAQVRVWTDSNAAKTIVSRRGFGKTRDVEEKFLWLQEVTKSGRVKIEEGPGRATFGGPVDEKMNRGAISRK